MSDVITDPVVEDPRAAVTKKPGRAKAAASKAATRTVGVKEAEGDAEAGAIAAMKQKLGLSVAPHDYVHTTDEAEPRPKRQRDAEETATDIAHQLAAQPQGRRQADVPRDKHGNRLPDTNPPRQLPVAVRPRRNRPDRFEPRYSNGQQVKKEAGWVYRWVREVGDDGKTPMLDRVEEFQDYNYEFVLDPTNSDKPIRSSRGVLMRGPAAQYALRAIDKSHLGTYNARQLQDPVKDIVKDLNRKMHDNVVNLIENPLNEETSGRVASPVYDQELGSARETFGGLDEDDA